MISYRKHHSASALLLSCLIGFSPLALAQQDWRIQSAVNLNKGSYSDSKSLDDQYSAGLKTDFDKADWGGAIGYQTTRINLLPALQIPQQKQDNWLASVHINRASELLSGLISYKLDLHHIQSRNASQSHIDALAPQITWMSAQHPLMLGINMASSNYPTMPTIKQYGTAIAWGFNHRQDWLELRTYHIQNLSPIQAEQKSSTFGQEVRLTHALHPSSAWTPQRITVGLERGEKIYHVDMVSQTIYNLPMLNKGGYNISSKWALSSGVNLVLQISQTKYTQTQAPIQTPNDFRLTSVSAQTTFAW